MLKQLLWLATTHTHTHTQIVTDMPWIILHQHWMQAWPTNRCRFKNVCFLCKYCTCVLFIVCVAQNNSRTHKHKYINVCTWLIKEQMYAYTSRTKATTMTNISLCLFVYTIRLLTQAFTNIKMRQEKITKSIYTLLHIYSHKFVLWLFLFWHFFHTIFLI